MAFRYPMPGPSISIRFEAFVSDLAIALGLSYELQVVQVRLEAFKSNTLWKLTTLATAHLTRTIFVLSSRPLILGK
jgi:hypothetical protein